MKSTEQSEKNGIPEVLGIGLYWNDVSIGFRFQTLGRTITETDVVNFVGATGMVEEMFTNVEYAAKESLMGKRPVPGSLVFCMAEGLLMQSTMQRTGMAFLEANLTIKAPTSVGDTIHVECEVIEARATSKPERGLLRTSNKVINQRNEIVAVYNPLRMVKTRPSS